MVSYRIEWKRSAVKELRNLPGHIVSRIIAAVEDLSINPFRHGATKLSGSENAYRIRVGDYRVVYTVETSVLLIEITRVRHRRDVYR